MSKLKGCCEIVLTDEKGNEIQHTKDYNMVTNAVASLFNISGATMASSNYNQTTYINNLYNNFRNLFGGVLLFDTNIEEDANKIYPPAGSKNVGHAGGTYSGSNTYRGTLNTNETGAIEGGYRYVFDFGTDKGNGTIKCVSLTSIWGGNIGWDNSLIDSVNPFTFDLSRGQNPAPLGNINFIGKRLIKIVSPKEYYFLMVNTTALEVYKYEIFNKPSISGNTISKLTLVKNYTSATRINTNLSQCFITDTHIINVYKVNNTQLHYIKLTIDGVLVQDKTITLDNSISDSLYGGGELDGYLYCYLSTHNLAKINIVTGATEILTNPYAQYMFNLTGNSYVNGKIIFSGGGQAGDNFGSIMYDTDFHLSQIRGSAYSSSEALFIDPTNPIARVTNIGSSGCSSYIVAPYLATIDNLTTPVTKTASMSMKVIYTLYETTEETTETD